MIQKYATPLSELGTISGIYASLAHLFMGRSTISWFYTPSNGIKPLKKKSSFSYIFTKPTLLHSACLLPSVELNCISLAYSQFTIIITELDEL